MSEVSIKSDAAQADNNTQPFEQRNFLVEIAGAIRDLLRQRFVVRRCASHRSTDPQIVQLHPVFPRPGFRLRSETYIMQHRVKEVAGAVARERPACSV